MLGTALDKGFSLVWVIVKVNFYFLLLSVMGGIVLGVGPAFQTMSDLYLEFDQNFQEMTLKRVVSYWRSNFKNGNRNFYLYFLTLLILGYNLYLAVQINQLLFFIISFILIFFSILATVIYLFMTLYTSEYQLDLRGILYLALTSTFLNFSSFFRLLFGILSIFMISWMMKGIVIFGTFAMLAYWTVVSTAETRKFVAHKLIGEKMTR